MLQIRAAWVWMKVLRPREVRVRAWSERVVGVGRWEMIFSRSSGGMERRDIVGDGVVVRVRGCGSLWDQF